MNGRRAVIGLCMAAALLVSAFAAQSASAETTAFTCSESVTTKTWDDAHCDKDEAGVANKFGHVAIAENKTTTITGATGTSKVTQKLRATINGINTELSTESISGSGSMHNATVEGKMQATGSGEITYTNVVVTQPANKGCKVYTDSPGTTKGEEGVIHTKPLKAATTEGMGLKFTPAEGEVFASFFMEGCTGSEALESLNKTYTVTGSVTGTPTGGETVFEHAATTAEGSLKLNGSIKAGIDGSLTISGRDAANVNDPYKALTATTPPYITD